MGAEPKGGKEKRRRLLRQPNTEAHYDNYRLLSIVTTIIEAQLPWEHHGWVVTREAVVKRHLPGTSQPCLNTKNERTQQLK